MHEIKHWASLITAVIETLCFSGMIFGWGPMSYILEKEGYFNSTCNSSASNINLTIPSVTQRNTGTICKKQEKMLNLVYTLSVAIPSILLVSLGYIFDRYGTWTVRFGAVTLYIAGCLTMAVTTRKSSWAVFLGMIFLGISGFPINMSNIPISNFFPKYRVLVIGVLNGAFDSSAVTFALIKIVYDTGIHLSSIMFFMASCALLMITRFLFLMPRMHIPSAVPDDFQYGIQCCSIKQQVTNTEQMNEYEKLTDETPENTVSLKSCLLSVSFILNFIHVGSLQLRNQFFYGTVKPWLVQVDHGNLNETSSYLNAFGIIQLCGILVSPVGGILTDFCIKKFSVNSSIESATRRAVAIYIGLSSVIATLCSITVLVPMLPLQYVSFFLQVVFRSFLYGGNAAFMLTMFPEKYFGKLYCFTILLASLIAFLQYPLFEAVTNIYGGDFTVMNVAMLIVSVATTIHPIVLYVRPVMATK